jgi:hypothetical protein
MNRRGVSILELTVSAVLLVALMTLCLTMLGAAASQQASGRRRAAALAEAANVLEQIAAVPFEELAGDRLAGWRLSPEAAAQLPGGTIEVAVDDFLGPPAGKRITVTIGWSDRAGEPARPVRLVTWRFAHGAGR